MDEVQLVTLLLENTEFALEVRSVQEIIRLIEITRVPHAPKAVTGVINLRGNIIPVMDLRIKFGLTPIVETDNTRIIISKSEGKKLGLIVDDVSEVVTLDVSSVQLPPVVEDEEKTEYIKGVGKIGERLLLILDLKKLSVYS